MAYEGSSTCIGRLNVHQCDPKSDVDAQNNLSISRAISKSCVVLQGLQNLSYPEAGHVCQESVPGKPCPIDQNDSFSERDHTMSSDPIPSINDQSADSGQGYGTLSIDSMNTDVFFEMPSVGYAPCSLLTPSGPVELGHSFIDNAACNDNSLDWGQGIANDNLRQTNEHTSNFAEDNMGNVYKLKCVSNIDHSASFYGHAHHPSFNEHAQSNMTFYGNAEFYSPAYETETSHTWTKSNYMGILSRKNPSSRMESDDRTHPENYHPSCLSQHGETWRPEYSLHNTVSSRHTPETGNRPGGDPEVFGYRKYYQDDSLLDARFQPSNNLSSECLLTSSNGSASPGMTSDERFAQLRPTSTETHFLTKCIETANAPSHDSAQPSLHRVNDNCNLGEWNHSVVRRALRGEMNPIDDSMQMDPRRPPQEEETSQDEKASRKSSPKAKSKKSDSVESLQHQLEMMEEKRRTRMQNRSGGFRFQLSGSGEQRTESSEGASIIDVDHMISSGVTVAGFKPRAIIRKRCKNNTPTEVKNIDYWHKRRKNNDSARKSRESKKEKEKHFYKRALELEYENVYLLECLNLAEAELASLGHQFVPPPFDQSNCFY